MLARGNVKLGARIASWSLPAHSTCPGASEICQLVCYAKQGFYRFKSTQDKLESNELKWQDPDWVEDATTWIKTHRPDAVRIHAAGDFHEVDYIQKWSEVIRGSVGITFYAYTRSWNVPELRPHLIQLSRLRNMYLWWSADRSMPAPPKTKGIMRAYMRMDDDDKPRWKPDLVFNELRSKFTPAKKANGTIVCPAEQRIERKVKITCDRCRLCFTSKLTQLQS